GRIVVSAPFVGRKPGRPHCDAVTDGNWTGPRAPSSPGIGRWTGGMRCNFTRPGSIRKDPFDLFSPTSGAFRLARGGYLRALCGPGTAIAMIQRKQSLYLLLASLLALATWFFPISTHQRG